MSCTWKIDTCVTMKFSKLCFRACSYGNLLPVNVEEENLFSKFHMLTHEVPWKALMSATVRLEAEHCIHPFCNKWDNLYRTVQNDKQKLALTAKAHWLASSPGLANFNKPKQRKYQICGLPSHCKKSSTQMAEIIKLQSKFFQSNFVSLCWGNNFWCLCASKKCEIANFQSTDKLNE